MNTMTMLFYLSYIALCSDATLYTGSFFAYKKNVTLPPIKNWYANLKKASAELDIYRGQEITQNYIIDYLKLRRSPDERKNYPSHEVGLNTYSGFRYTLTTKPTKQMYVYQFLRFAGDEEHLGRYDVLKDNIKQIQRRQFRGPHRHRRLKFNFSLAKPVTIPNKLKGIGRNFIYANKTRPTSPYSETGFKWPPALEDFQLQRPIAGTVKDGFRILFSEDPKKRIVSIKVNANRNKAFKGFGDNSPGQITVYAELKHKQNKTKWVVTYRNSCYIENHDVIFYWYMYTLSAENKTYYLYGYEHYFRLYFERLLRPYNMKHPLILKSVKRKF